MNLEYSLRYQMLLKGRPTIRIQTDVDGFQCALKISRDQSSLRAIGYGTDSEHPDIVGWDIRTYPRPGKKRPLYNGRPNGDRLSHQPLSEQDIEFYNKVFSRVFKSS